ADKRRRDLQLQLQVLELDDSTNSTNFEALKMSTMSTPSLEEKLAKIKSPGLQSQQKVSHRAFLSSCRPLPTGRRPYIYSYLGEFQQPNLETSPYRTPSSS